MTFWAGFAQAFRDADEQKFKEKLISDERAWETEQLAEQRKYDEDTWKRRFDAETAASLEELFVKETLTGVGTGGGTRRSGSGGSASDRMSFEAFMAIPANQQLDPEVISQLAPYEDKLFEINEAIQSGLTDAKETGRVIPPEALNGFIVDLIPSDPTETITSESIIERGKLYGINVSQRTADTLSTTLNLQGQNVAPEVVLNPQVFSSTDPSLEKTLRDQISGELIGSLEDQLRIARDQDNFEEADRLKRLIAVGANDPTAVLNTAEGTDLVVSYLKNYDVDINRMFPTFVPSIRGGSDAEMQAQLGALERAGLIRPGSRVKVHYPDGSSETRPVN